MIMRAVVANRYRRDLIVDDPFLEIKFTPIHPHSALYVPNLADIQNQAVLVLKFAPDAISFSMRRTTAGIRLLASLEYADPFLLEKLEQLLAGWSIKIDRNRGV